MSDYKNTLNLPKTEFPMKGNLPNKEPLIQEKWEKENLYSQLLDSNKNREKYILHDGPPYANGDIHIGHAVNKILKDVIVRSKILSGYNVPFVPGWDCHGLPIEIEVEKKIKKGEELSDMDFRKLCREYALNQVERQKKDFKRLGVLGDWENPYLTSNKKFEASTLKALEKIYNNGHLEKGFKPVHWCVKIQSALAEAEVEYQEKESIAIDVKFEVTSLNEVKRIFDIKDIDKKVFVVIWTTTPWTLPSNKSIAVKSDLNYILISNNREIYIIAESLFEKFQERTNLELSILARCSGENLINLEANHPFLDNKINIISSDHVTDDSGTGCVHIAPAHGIEDFELGKKHNLEVVNPIQSDGIFSGLPEELNGTHVYKLDEKIINILTRKDKLLSSNKFKHSYPHCWRTKTPLIYRATPQWFISMKKNNLIDKTLEKIPEVEWLPAWGKARIEGMISQRPDWCISRQRKWGVPITLLINKKTGEPHSNSSIIFSRICKLVEEHGIEKWFEIDVDDLIDNPEDYEKVQDTLDVWFDSGSSHAAVLETSANLRFPADLYLEGSDQHRGWFQSSLLTSIAVNDSVPYKAAMTHGFTVDGRGNKMSKSKGNVIAPQKIINRLGSDILRLWVASTDSSSEMTVSEEILNRTSDKYRKIRNTIRFLLSNIDDYDPETFSVKDTSIELDKWIVLKAINLQKVILDHYNKFNFHIISQLIHGFCVNELGSFYLDVIKDRQYTCKKDSAERKSAQNTMYVILQMLLSWIAPICPHTAEEAWSHVPKNSQKSIFFNKWLIINDNEIPQTKINQENWEKILEIKKHVSKELENKREKNIIGSSLDADVKILCSDNLYNLLSEYGDELKFIFITSKVILVRENNLKDGQIYEINGENLKVEIENSKNKKCERCWHRCISVGTDKNHKTLCVRCISNVYGSGEIRRYA